jgi:hypothetical protein
MLRATLLLGLAAGSLWGDARYKLAYRVQANAMIRIVAGIAGLSKMNSPGEEVLLQGSRLMVRGEKTSIVLDYATGKMILIDHTDKTFERLQIDEMRKRMAADIPEPLVNGLRKLFPDGGGGMAHEVKVERSGNKGAMKSLEQFRAKHGLSYLLPAMESVVSLTPTVAQSIEGVRKNGELVEAIRVQVGASGRLIDAVVEILDYREGVVKDSEFLPPKDYVEVI